MKKIVLSLIIVMVAFAAYSQPRPFEVSKTSSDPFIAEDRGFESLFVNPAGMAGETDIFTWDIEAGTKGKRSTYEAIEFMMNNSEMLTGETTGAELTPADAEQIMDLLAENMTDATVQDMLAGTDLLITNGIDTVDELVVFLETDGVISEADALQIASNVESDPTIVEDALAGLVGDLKVSVEFGTKIGTLIKGFGLGYYADVYSILDAGAMGFETMIVESGLKAGYGFNLGPLALGVSGDFAVVGDLTKAGPIALDPASLGNIMNQTMYYGYAWGIDFGANFDITPSLTVGAVMTDIIGSYSPVGYLTVDQFLNGQNAVQVDYQYTFDLDLDVGITWHPQLGNGKLFNASFSADYYDIVGLFRPETQPQTFQDVFNHMRFGAHIELLSFINGRAQYYQEYFTLGAGVDLLFLEVFGEFQFKQTFDDIGGAMLVKLHF